MGEGRTDGWREGGRDKSRKIGGEASRQSGLRKKDWGG